MRLGNVSLWTTAEIEVFDQAVGISISLSVVDAQVDALPTMTRAQVLSTYMSASPKVLVEGNDASLSATPWMAIVAISSLVEESRKMRL